MQKFIYFILGIILIVGSTSCSGEDGNDSSSATGNVIVQATVTVPSSSISSPMGGLMKAAGVKAAITEVAAGGVTCHAEDLSGTTIGNEVTADSNGVCTVTGLTAAQYSARIIIVADSPTMSPVETLIIPTTTQQAAVTA